MKKKVLPLLLTLCLALSLAACGGNSNTPSGDTSAPPPSSSEASVTPNEVAARDYGDGTYEGETDENGNRSGYGVWIYHNFRYEGYFENDMPNGEGTLYKANAVRENVAPGTTYSLETVIEGQWVDGFANGAITMSWSMNAGDNPTWEFEVENGCPTEDGKVNANAGIKTYELKKGQLIAAVPPWGGVKTDSSVAAPSGSADPSSTPNTSTDPGTSNPSKLPAAFEENGYPGTMMAVGTAYDYTTLCYDDPSVTTTGIVTITDYKIIKSDKTHEAMDGYEWRIATVNVAFTDDNNWEYGNLYRQKDADYYSGKEIKYYTNQAFYPKSEGDDIFSVNYLGESYECLFTFNMLENNWNNSDSTFKQSYEASFLVPIGYDGVVLVFHSAEHETDHEDSANTVDFPAALNDPNTLFFRLAN